MWKANTNRRTAHAAAILGESLLEKARNHMLSPSSAKTKRLIGKFYKAGEKIAEESNLRLRHPDAIAFFRAYSQAIDSSKHGCSVGQHLSKDQKARVGMKT